LRPFFPRDNDITDVIENTFSTEEERFGELISIPLIPGGENIEVTELNKKEYVEYVPSSSPLPFSLSLSLHSLAVFLGACATQFR
jgi:hypothetical protein